MHGAPRPTAMSASESIHAQKSDTRAVTHSPTRLICTTSSTASSSWARKPTPRLSAQHVQPEAAPCSAAAACPVHGDAMLAPKGAQILACRRARSCRIWPTTSSPAALHCSAVSFVTTDSARKPLALRCSGAPRSRSARKKSDHGRSFQSSEAFLTISHGHLPSERPPAAAWMPSVDEKRRRRRQII